MDKRIRIHSAITTALKARGYSHADVARILGKSVGTVTNSISACNFSPKVAKEWSQKLGIPESVFLEGDNIRPDADLQIQQLKLRVAVLENDLAKLQVKVMRLEGQDI